MKGQSDHSQLSSKLDMSNETLYFSAFKRTIPIGSTGSAHPAVWFCQRQRAQAVSSEWTASLDRKHDTVKRRVALHLGYVGTDFKGDRLQRVIWSSDVQRSSRPGNASLRSAVCPVESLVFLSKCRQNTVQYFCISVLYTVFNMETSHRSLSNMH